jgi:4-amino-4-deoxy-L-arabinose transferase-like glycosyltransferase
MVKKIFLLFAMRLYPIYAKQQAHVGIKLAVWRLGHFQSFFVLCQDPSGRVQFGGLAGLDFGLKGQNRMDRSRRWLEALTPALLLVSVGAVLLVITFARHMGVDEGVWSYMGRMWNHGQPVYKATMDNKPPGIFMLFTLSYALVGPGVWLPRLMGVLCMTAAAGGIYLLGRRLHSRQAGLLAALMFGLAMGWEALDGPNAAQTESFMVLPTVFAFLILLRSHADPRCGASVNSSLGNTTNAENQAGCNVGLPVGAVEPFKKQISGHQHSHPGRIWLLLAGVLIGCAISFKQTALFSIPAWGAIYLSLAHRDGRLTLSRWRPIAWDAAAFGVGVLAGVAAFLLPVLACGVDFKDYWFGTWVLPSLPGTGNSSLSSRLDKTFHAWCQTSLVLFYLPLAAFIWRSKTLRAAGLPVVALAVWLAMEFAGSALSGYWYGHQIKQIIPVLSLIGGLGLAAAVGRATLARRAVARGRAAEQGRSANIPRATRPSGTKLHALPILFPVLMLAIAIAWFPLTMLHKAVQGPGRDLNREVGLCVRDRSDGANYVLDLSDEGGSEQILAWSDRPSPSRWFNGFFLRLPQARADLSRDISLHPPRFVIAPRWWRHKDFHWPACMEPLRPFCTRVCSHVMDEAAYDIYECLPDQPAPATQP